MNENERKHWLGGKVIGSLPDGNIVSSLPGVGDKSTELSDDFLLKITQIFFEKGGGPIAIYFDPDEGKDNEEGKK